MCNVMMYNVIGIDPGTNSAGVTIMGIEGDDIVSIDTIPLISKNMDIYNSKNGSLYHKLIYYKKSFTEILKKYKPYIVAMETPFVGKNVSAVIPLSKVNAVFEMCVAEYDANMIFHKVTPTEAKRYMHVVDTSKEAMVKAIKSHPVIYSLLPDLDRTQDELDSISIAYHLYNMIRLHPYLFVK